MITIIKDILIQSLWSLFSYNEERFISPNNISYDPQNNRWPSFSQINIIDFLNSFNFAILNLYFAALTASKQAKQKDNIRPYKRPFIRIVHLEVKL